MKRHFSLVSYVLHIVSVYNGVVSLQCEFRAVDGVSINTLTSVENKDEDQYSKQSSRGNI
jgi:hypothetical protein